MQHAERRKTTRHARCVCRSSVLQRTRHPSARLVRCRVDPNRATSACSPSPNGRSPSQKCRLQFATHACLRCLAHGTSRLPTAAPPRRQRRVGRNSSPRHPRGAGSTEHTFCRWFAPTARPASAAGMRQTEESIAKATFSRQQSTAGDVVGLSFMSIAKISRESGEKLTSRRSGPPHRPSREECIPSHSIADPPRRSRSGLRDARDGQRRCLRERRRGRRTSCW